MERKPRKKYEKRVPTDEKLYRFSKRHVPLKGSDGQMHYVYSLNVPQDIVERFQEGIAFQVKLTEDGILFVPVVVQEVSKTITVKEYAPVKINEVLK
jgi:hypothetical protein